MEKLGIIGCGTMGHSIAVCAAWAGIAVEMYGINEAELVRADSAITSKLDILFRNGLFAQEESKQIKDRIVASTSIDKVAQKSSFIIEAIPEDINLKKDLFLYLDKICEKKVILASNTSALSPTSIASVCENPERVLVTHFWNPAHLVPLVEVVRGKKTNDDTVKRAFDLLRLMKKKPIEVKKEVPGFIANRLQFALFREAQYLLEEGIASREDIDAAAIYSIGRRLSVTGPLASADMGGLDVFSAISDYLFPALSHAKSSLPALRKLVDNNKLGLKTGEGYYTWDRSFSEEMSNKREAELIRFIKQDRSNDTALEPGREAVEY